MSSDPTLFDYMIYISSSISSAIITKTMVSPLERIKILKQVQSYYASNKYTGLSGSLRYIYHNEGLLGYFKGNLANLTRVIPNYAIKFPMNDIYKSKIKNYYNTDKLSFLQLLSSGMLSGLNLVLFTFPFDVVRTRMTLDKNMASYNSIFNCGKQIIKTEGFTSLYKGLSISIMTSPLYIGLQLSLYEVFKEHFDDNKLLSGASAGIIAQTLMYPGDTIKRQMQINGLNGLAKKYNNLRECIRYIYYMHGIKGFYPAVGINIIKAIPEAALQFAIYDYCKEYLSSIRVLY